MNARTEETQSGQMIIVSVSAQWAGKMITVRRRNGVISSITGLCVELTEELLGRRDLVNAGATLDGMDRVVVRLLHVQLVVMDNNVLMEVLSQEELDQVASNKTTANANAQPDSPAQIAKSQPNAELDIIIYHAKTEAHLLEHGVTVSASANLASTEIDANSETPAPPDQWELSA